MIEIPADKDKIFYMDWWIPTLGEEEALRSWEIKQTQKQIVLGFQFMPDIQPYKSMATGEMITSRSQHREHLKEHRLNEIGNEMPYIERRAKEVVREREKRDDALRLERIKRAVYQRLGD